MKPENVPDELLIQAGIVLCTATNLNEYSRHCVRNLGHLHNWLRYSDDASRQT